MKLEDLFVYQLAMEIGDEIYFQIENWDNFAKWTTGKQLIEAVDSIAANISEGFGRYHYKENRQFQYFSRGSQTETRTWLTKARNRKHISEETYIKFIERLDELGKRHYSYINSIGNKPAELL